VAFKFKEKIILLPQNKKIKLTETNSDILLFEKCKQINDLVQPCYMLSSEKKRTYAVLYNGIGKAGDFSKGYENVY
jgi:hypothetical protein